MFDFLWCADEKPTLIMIVPMDCFPLLELEKVERDSASIRAVRAFDRLNKIRRERDNQKVNQLLP